ncbi:ATP cone domain-containing protein [Microbacterium aurum]|nr:ATP cone domain-containing protein [Microbacterium aurum]MBM7826602.1 transcriptional regulator NrdR family protein [Microbacterium aurum]
MVDEAITDIERQLPELPTRLSAEEFRRHPSIVGAIPDAAISEAVERVLRNRDGAPYRVAELLYAMAIHGRNDNRPGWPGALAVLNWLQARHPGVQPSQQRGQVADQHWPRLAVPHRMDWRPEKVMKRDERTPDFEIRQLRKGVHAALWGRQDADAKALMIAHLVLSDIRGQRIVQSTQISASVLAHLRRVDDVGYLRWATIVKKIRGIREFADEAADLIHAPSPRLLVTQNWRRWARA